jgi:hypothetical protein
MVVNNAGMGIEPLLDRFARVRARGRAARVAGRVVLAGALVAAVLLFLARAGFATPLVYLPGMPESTSAAERVFGYLLISLAGILQGVFLLGVVFALALGVRVLGGWLLRPGRRAVARALDRTLRTDRFTAALEATGPLGALVVRDAAATKPPSGTLAPRRSRRRERWLRRLAVALVLIVAIAPGTAPGDEGAAPVAGEPEGGRTDVPLVLTLAGERKRYRPGYPVPVQVIGEALAAPTDDLRLPVRVAIDDGAEVDAGVRLFLPAGAPGQDSAVFDLRELAGDLPAGEHRAVAFAGDARSNEYVFRIEEEGDQGGGGASPQPQPQPEPTPDQHPQPDGGANPDWRPKFVEPLVREGETVKKNARVPIEAPGGGAPAPRTLDEAWPELERRREAALDRPGLSPAARKLIREYFEKLRPEAPR